MGKPYPQLQAAEMRRYGSLFNINPSVWDKIALSLFNEQTVQRKSYQKKK